MSGSNKTSDSMSEYHETAFRSDAIPKQKPLENPGGFAKALEGGDLIERLSWANYSGLDIHVRPSSTETYQKRASGSDKRELAGPAWTHQQKPAEFIKTRWQLLLMLAGSFADYFLFKWMLTVLLIGMTITAFKFGVDGIFVGLQWLFWLVVLHLFFRYPFTWFLERNPDFIVKDLGCGFFRPSGMVKFRTWREETFEAPFIEFDPYISYHVQPKGPVSYKLQLRHRYSGWQTAVAEVHSTQKVELYAHWDELQRYMDVSQPLPDIPALEPYRHLDPTTAEYDAAGKRGRPADYWATLDLEWWEKEGYPAHMEKIRNFPWSSLEDQMRYSVPNLDEAAMA
ncbi:DUF1761 domain-containing protein [Marinobacter adhaerens]|uniref:DUF1761 domain-containing protein n=1 Tax=Marinobacter adhaerens TaxID=1033846 RepID=A0A851HSK3_9GAMM|nr:MULTISPECIES: DUF1761 domain-containing protein [Marinobacter]NWN92384.1 DUF1761 domain-containing protein [Marinobacter adhaerens]